MDIKQRVSDTIKTHNLFEDGAHIVLGLSGGPDSVCLFDLLCELAEVHGYHIHPVHVNHKFRPGAAEADAEFVEGLCRERGLACRTFVTDCNELAAREGLTSEEAGRKARYEAFFAVAAEVASSDRCSQVAIAVAQNANDQAETILFRMLRGTGIDGLAGIAYKRYERGFAITRPLLDINRTEIEKYCEERELSPRIDHTNQETVYTRNKIRLELLPFLAERFNPNVIETIDRLGRAAAADKDYIAGQAAAAYAAVRIPSANCDADRASGAAEAAVGTAGGAAVAAAQQTRRAATAAAAPVSENAATARPAAVTVDAAGLAALHRAVRIRVYNLILSDIGLSENITEGQLESIERVLFSDSPSAMCNLVDEYAVYREYERLRFCRRHGSEPQGAEYRLTFEEASDQGPGASGQGSEASGAITGIFALPIPVEDARHAVRIRKRQDGDTIAIKTADGQLRRKKLQDFFVDAKLPKNARDEVDLLAYGSQILWILPSEAFANPQYREKGRFSADFKQNDETQTIIKLEILRNL